MGSQGELAVFEVPYCICGKLVAITHKNRLWESELKPTLLDALEAGITLSVESSGRSVGRSFEELF